MVVPFCCHVGFEDMDHQSIEKELSAYLDGELAPVVRERLEAHVGSCVECADMLSVLEKNRRLIAGLSSAVPSRLKDSVMAEIHARFQDELSAYLDGELAPVVRERLEAHLRCCDACSAQLAGFRRNRERIKGLERRAPSSIQRGVMARIGDQVPGVSGEVAVRLLRLPAIGGRLLDIGRWFLRPVTAGATGILTLALVLGAFYFYPSGSHYEETLDFYFGLHTEQIGSPFSDDEAAPLPLPGQDGDTEMFLNLYLENVGIGNFSQQLTGR